MPPALRLAALFALLPAWGIATQPAGAVDTSDVDQQAHQKYASVSGLYWHVDLATAKAAAQKAGKPILHLRMLGKLDEDLSCANSRLFRATLYANKTVSKFLRDNFILYWSSERPVPRVTIDFGDGRKLERTTTGNSAHYVLDEHGNVLDVLPGLYAPVAFKTELEDSLALAKKVRGMTDNERADAIVAYHEAEAQSSLDAWTRLAGIPYLADATQLLTQKNIESALALAQRSTMMKAAIEVPDLRYISPQLAAGAYERDDVALWAAAGQALYGIGDIERAKQAEGTQPILYRAGRVRGAGDSARLVKATTPPRVLDAQSIALVSRLHDGELPSDLRSSDGAREAMLRKLEQHLVADSALNQLRLRPEISREIIRRGGKLDFESLNAWIYSTVFHTPSTDAWLGLLPRTDFTGLPGDGVVMP